ncbi:restriction endonuclease subunit S [Lactobacillus intestinalis]|uniref:restriction endonuclease subunit S n=1 Tax=Lactobacillus intestinalis TaxID=151781 RepID=UPI002103FD13|nr:restriction endonuclease subunit S [Lactobacillus intestinalis]
MPSYEEEQCISPFSKLDTLIIPHQRKLSDLEKMKSGLLQKMFPKNGEDKPEIRFPEFTDAWEQHKLGNVANFINGRAYSQNELLDEGKYKVLRVGNFYTNDSWYYSNMELDDKYYANDGDLLYTWSATFGPHIWRGEKVIYHYHIWKIELSQELDKRFAIQLLLRDKNILESNTNGSTMAHITKKGMEEKKVRIPSKIQEQSTIGMFLKDFDTLITLHQRKPSIIQKESKNEFKFHKRKFIQRLFLLLDQIIQRKCCQRCNVRKVFKQL